MIYLFALKNLFISNSLAIFVNLDYLLIINY